MMSEEFESAYSLDKNIHPKIPKWLSSFKYDKLVHSWLYYVRKGLSNDSAIWKELHDLTEKERIQCATEAFRAWQKESISGKPKTGMLGAAEQAAEGWFEWGRLEEKAGS